MDFKRKISEVIIIDGVSSDEIYKNIGRVQDGLQGDYCLPCFKYAKQLRKNPTAIAEELSRVISERTAAKKEYEWIDKVEPLNGYLNFFINKSVFAAAVLAEVCRKGDDWVEKPSNGKTVCIDFSSVNIAKPFHIGHLLTTVIGGSLYRIYGYLGYKTVGINHLGDWGTQFGKMITAYLKWGDGADIKELGSDASAKLYAKFHEEAEKDDSLNAEGRAWFKKLENGDAEALRLFRNFREITLRELKTVYKKLGVRFDSYKGESFFNKKTREVVRLLEKKKLLIESDGARVVSLEEYGMPPSLILKSDGTTLYATRDIATALYRKKYYNFDKCLYVVAYQQELYFKQLFKVLEKMGCNWAGGCVHVPFGMVSLEGAGVLSTRKGNVIFLRDVLDTSVKRAYDIIEAKNPKLNNKKQVARYVGVGAVIFGALANSRIKDVSFSYDKALNFDGETGPYIQYTHARCCSVAEKAGSTIAVTQVDCNMLADEHSFAVIKLLNEFENVVADAAEKYEPSIISKYLIDLSQSYNKFYVENRIITEDTRQSAARLCLTNCVKNTLKNGLKLLMIQAPEKM